MLYKFAPLKRARFHRAEFNAQPLAVLRASCSRLLNKKSKQRLTTQFTRSEETFAMQSTEQAAKATAYLGFNVGAEVHLGHLAHHCLCAHGLVPRQCLACYSILPEFVVLRG
jgi:hypothetical protein